MERHPFDAVSFVFGLAFAGLGTWVLIADEVPDLGVGRWLGPALLLVAGLVILYRVAAQGRTDRE